MGSGLSTDDENDKTGALYQAIRREQFQIATDLIVKGAAVNCINYFGKTPLIETCWSHRTSNRRGSTVNYDRDRFVKFLVTKKCDINKYDIYGWTALMYAEKNGHDNIIDILDDKEKVISSEDSHEKRISLVISAATVSCLQAEKIEKN